MPDEITSKQILPIPSQRSNISPGATITSIYVERSVKTYAIPEHELDSLGLLNSYVALWSSIGTGFLFLVLDCIYSNLLSSTPLPVEAKKLNYLFGAIAVAAYAAACITHVMKKSRITKIKEESGDAGLHPAERVLDNELARQAMTIASVILAAMTVPLFRTTPVEGDASLIPYGVFCVIGSIVFGFIVWRSRRPKNP